MFNKKELKITSTIKKERNEKRFWCLKKKERKKNQRTKDRKM